MNLTLRNIKSDETSLARFLLYFLRLGTFGFGGPIALASRMESDLVRDRNWISQDGHYELGQWVLQDKGAPPFGHVTHIFGTTAKIAYLYWQKYEFTQDKKWLAERAFPMLRGCVEFYRNFPNLWKEEDGKYHIHHTNSNEPAWGVRDSDEDMAAMHGIIPCAIRASETLNVEPELRARWKEFLANLAPIPTSDTPDALKPENYDGPHVWLKGTRPAAKVGGMLPDGNTLPQWNFDLATVNCEDRELMKSADNTLDAFFRRGVSSDWRNCDSRSGEISKRTSSVSVSGARNVFRNTAVLPNCGFTTMKLSGSLPFPSRPPLVPVKADVPFSQFAKLATSPLAIH